MSLFIALGLISFLEPLLIHLCGQFNSNRMSARCALKSGLCLSGVLVEGDLDLACGSGIHRIGLPGKKACDLQTAILINIIMVASIQPYMRQCIGYDRLCQSGFRYTKRNRPGHLLRGKAVHAFGDRDLTIRRYTRTAVASVGIIADSNGVAYPVDLIHINDRIIGNLIHIRLRIAVRDLISPRRIAVALQIFVRDKPVDDIAIFVNNFDAEALAVVFHIIGRTSRYRVFDRIAGSGGQSELVIRDRPLIDLVAVLSSAVKCPVRFSGRLKRDLVGILRTVRIPVLGLDSGCVLCLVDRDLAVFVRILGEVNARRVGDGDRLALSHRGKGIVKTVGSTVIGIRAAVAADLHVVVKDQRVSGDDILDIDIGDRSGCGNSDGIIKCSCCFVKYSRLVGIGLWRLRFVKDDSALDLVIEFNLFSRAVEQSFVGKAEADVCRIQEMMIIRVILVEFYYQVSVGTKCVVRIYLVGSALIDNVDLKVTTLRV